MASSGVEQRFLFNASAVALGGRIRRPKDSFIKSVASSVIPVTGGLAEAVVKGPENQRGTATYKSASTRVSGDFADPAKAVQFTNGNHSSNNLPTITQTTATLKGLRIEVPVEKPVKGGPKTRSLSAQTLNAHLETTSDRKGQNTFTKLDADFVGLTVDDKFKLSISTSTRICTDYPTYGRLLTAFQRDEKFRRQFGNQFYPNGREGNLISNGTPIMVTVVTSISWVNKAAEGVTIEGNVLKIEGLGSAYLGEVYIDSGTRRLTLLRLQLGSPCGGEITACDCLGNGPGWPPEG